MYCKKCGSAVVGKYCSVCGARVRGEKEEIRLEYLRRRRAFLDWSSGLYDDMTEKAVSFNVAKACWDAADIKKDEEICRSKGNNIFTSDYDTAMYCIDQIENFAKLIHSAVMIVLH